MPTPSFGTTKRFNPALEKSRTGFPNRAYFVGGPMDGQYVQKKTNHYARFRADDGGQMSQYLKAKLWLDPMAELRFPRGGYQVTYAWDGDQHPAAANYVHGSRWIEFHREPGPNANREDIEWLKQREQTEKALCAEHGVTAEEVDITDYLAEMLEDFERDARGLDVRTYLQERRKDYLAAGEDAWGVLSEPVPFRDDWPTAE
jgi:hypothetical protein